MCVCVGGGRICILIRIVQHSDWYLLWLRLVAAPGVSANIYFVAGPCGCNFRYVLGSLRKGTSFDKFSKMAN